MNEYNHDRIWRENPFNPMNNVNYIAEESKLKCEINSLTSEVENNFFHTVPELMSNEVVLYYQKKFISKMLSYSLKYPNILYCMDNEIFTAPEWVWC